MKKTHYLVVAVFGLAVTTAFVSLTTFASLGEPGVPNADWAQKHQEMQQIMADGDYDTWAALMQEQVDTMRARASELESNITLENFQQHQQIHQLIQDGKIDEAKELMQDFGFAGPGHLGLGPMGIGMKYGFHHQFNQPATDN